MTMQVHVRLEQGVEEKDRILDNYSTNSRSRNELIIASNSLDLGRDASRCNTL
jgi:hypothetical protein